MDDVVRLVREFEEVVYMVGPDTVRKAVLDWLIDKNGSVFNDETTMVLCAGGSVVVTTRYASVDTVPKGGDAKQAPCGSNGSAVGESRDAR